MPQRNAGLTNTCLGCRIIDQIGLLGAEAPTVCRRREVVGYDEPVAAIAVVCVSNTLNREQIPACNRRSNHWKATRLQQATRPISMHRSHTRTRRSTGRSGRRPWPRRRNLGGVEHASSTHGVIHVAGCGGRGLVHTGESIGRLGSLPPGADGQLRLCSWAAHPP